MSEPKEVLEARLEAVGIVYAASEKYHSLRYKAERRMVEWIDLGGEGG